MVCRGLINSRPLTISGNADTEIALDIMGDFKLPFKSRWRLKDETGRGSFACVFRENSLKDDD